MAHAGACVRIAAETHADCSIVGSAPFMPANVEGMMYLFKFVCEQVVRFRCASTDECSRSASGLSCALLRDFSALLQLALRRQEGGFRHADAHVDVDLRGVGDHFQLEEAGFSFRLVKGLDVAAPVDDAGPSFDCARGGTRRASGGMVDVPTAACFARTA